MNNKSIVQMAVSMTEMDAGIFLDTAERQDMVDRILGKVEKELGV
jgi:hypothetical protein